MPNNQSSPTPGVSPALSAEEWDEIVSIRARNPDIIFAGDAQELMDRRPHAAAAIALHGQTFGFSSEDVGLLRRVVAEDWTGPHGEVYDEGMPLLDLANRIAALLPPSE